MKKLSSREYIFLVILGLPSFGMVFSYTLITMYLPFFIAKLSNATITGIMIGGESIFAIFVPFVVGAWSERLKTFLGRRLPFIFAGGALIILSLIIIPPTSDSLILLGMELAIFYIGYFTFYTAYFAIFPDQVPYYERGRSQGIQGAFRSLGLMLALASSGYLLHVWKPLPFLIAALLIIIVTIVIYYGIRSRIKHFTLFETKTNLWLVEWKLIYSDKKIRLWFITNSLWESSISALKVFIVLYFTRGLHFTLIDTSAALSLVGIAAIVAAPISGILADRYSHRSVIMSSVIFFCLGLWVPIFTVNSNYIAFILPVAFAAVVLMTLPYSVLMGFLPKEKYHGVGAAIFGFSQGIGALVGPLLAGLAIDAAKHFEFLAFAQTQGYAAVFPISSLLLIFSIPFVIKLFYTKKRFW